jgi:RHS repeat-associated protein
LTSSFAKTAVAMGAELVKIHNFQGVPGALPPGHGGINPGNGHGHGGGNSGNGGGNGGSITDPAPVEDPNVGEKFIFYYHPDHLGSSSYISDANGEVSQHLEYFAFGETFVEEHSNTSYTPYLFNGKELDDETGLYYYSARYFDPKTGIFESVDPLAEETMTPYAYCNNNPINLIDPNGKLALENWEMWEKQRQEKWQEKEAVESGTNKVTESVIQGVINGCQKVTAMKPYQIILLGILCVPLGILTMKNNKFYKYNSSDWFFVNNLKSFIGGLFLFLLGVTLLTYGIMVMYQMCW